MSKIRFKNLIFLFLIIACVAVISGCVKKEIPKPVENRNTQQVNTKNTNTNIPDEPEPTEDGSGEEIDTSWLTYRNEEYGFEVRYPREWSEEKNKLFINGTNQAPNTEFYDGGILEWFIIDGSDISEAVNNIGKNLLNSPNEELTLEDLKFKKEEIKFFENKAFRLIYKMTYGGSISEDSLITETLISYNNRIFKFVSTTIGGDYEKYSDITDKIVSSMKFLDNGSEEIDISDWKTYTNEEYDFEFKYPNNWMYSYGGEPNPDLLRWVYFFRQNPKDSKNFDRIEIKIYNTSDQEYLSDDSIKKEDFTRIQDAAKNNNGFVEEYSIANINKRVFKKLIIKYYEDTVKGYYWTIFKNKEYSINYVIYNYPKETEIVFKKMLSEFKFLE